MPDPTSALTTVVVNWNTVDLLDDCLAGIAGATPAGLDNHVVVVDNASADGSVAHLRRHWPGTTVMANDANVGFCRANNQAIRATSSPYVLLVNTDARLAPGCIGHLLDRFAADPRAAVVGPRLAYADGSFQRWTAGRDFSLPSLSLWLLGADRVVGTGAYLARDTNRAFRPGWVSSAVMALRRTALDEVGLLDESIFVYMDDVDLCARATAADWHVWYEPAARATHLMGASSQRPAGGAAPEALRALNRWYARRHGPGRARVLRGVEVVGFAGRCLAYRARGLVTGSDADRARAAAHATHLTLALEATADA